MRRSLVILVLLGALIFPNVAMAQSDVTFTTVDVSIWPEYEFDKDHPDKLNALVIYKYVLSPEVKLPMDITYRIPTTAIQPHVVAVGNTLDTVTDQNVKFSSVVNGAWIDVLVTMTGPAVQLEYYDFSLTKTGNTRQYSYVWPANYAVKNLRFELREPLQATNLVSDPVLNDAGTDNLGFHYSELQAADLPVGGTFSVKIFYDRNTDMPSASQLAVQPSDSLAQSSSLTAALTSYLPWILAVMGVVLIVGGGVWYWQSGRERGKRGSHHRHVPRDDDDETEDDDGEQIYCHQCGKRAQTGDRFCRACGTRLRRED
jgi:hypothetical protein